MAAQQIEAEIVRSKLEETWSDVLGRLRSELDEHKGEPVDKDYIDRLKITSVELRALFRPDEKPAAVPPKKPSADPPTAGTLAGVRLLKDEEAA